MTLKRLLAGAAIAVALAVNPVSAESPADLNDLEIAHVAYTADNIDIRYAHLALGISTNPEIHKFAKTMIRDHSKVNELALALLKKLKVNPKDNFLSRALIDGSEKLVDEMSGLRGAVFDKRYAENELAYHQAVNKLVEHTFIPNLKNPDVKALFKQGLQIFKAHEKHAQMMVKAVQ